MNQKRKPWWRKWFVSPRELRDMGVVGINMRNARYLLPNNPRKLYVLVDDKVITKGLAEERHVTVPKTYCVLRSPSELKRLNEFIEGVDSFVMKPSRGSGGKGVLVIRHRDGDKFVKPSGALLSEEDIRHHASNILAGLHSLGGRRDKVLVEYCVSPSTVLNQMSYLGAPDIRIVMIHGYPVMAMLRSSTKESDGRSNLHQGAVGVGIDLATGMTIRAIHHGSLIENHPDLKIKLAGRQIPNWDRMLEIAVTCYEMTGLGYLGVDLMVDETLGPMLIEVNARPGLAIQTANGVGLMKRLEPAISRYRSHPNDGLAERIAFSRENFRHLNGVSSDA